MTTHPAGMFGGGDYQEIRLLGQGGFAQVYLVEDNLGKQWALKQLKQDLIRQDPRVLERFEREAQIQAHLKHPHIAGVHTFNPREGYLVIDYIDGRNLRKLIEDDFPDGMDLDTALNILQPIGEALTYIHEDAGFAHLDITPRNILIQEKQTHQRSTERHVVLADFGLARVVDSDGWANLSIIAGTPGYWAPEQRGLVTDKPGTRSDIYSLGLVAGVMLTGRSPEEVLDILRGTSNMLLPTFPPEVQRVLQRATEEDPKKRYASVKSLITAFRRAVEALEALRPGSTPPPPPRTGWLRKIVAVAPGCYAVGITVVLLGFIAWNLVQGLPITHWTRLGGVGLGTYCKSLGYAGNNGDVFCSTTLNLTSVCKWQYRRNDLYFKLQNPQDALTGTCFDSQNNNPVGMLTDIPGYCQDQHNGFYGMPEAKPVGNAWICEQLLDMTLVCSWQYDRTDVQARKNDVGLWSCYGLF